MKKLVNDVYKSLLICPRCYYKLEEEESQFVCNNCDALFEYENGILDLHYTEVPEHDGMRPYLWSDQFYFENLLMTKVKNNMTILEICSGANFIVPFILERINKRVTYISIDNSVYNLLKQKKAMENFKINSIIGDATSVPISSDSIDIIIGHHAINDIWATRGEVGLEKAIKENIRLLKPGGTLIHSHNYNAIDEVRHGDISSRMVSLNGIIHILGDNWNPLIEYGGELEWLIAQKPH